MLMRVNIRCHICLSFDQSVWSYIVNTHSVTEDVHFSFVVLPATSNCRQLFCTDVVNWSYTTVPLCSVPTTVPVHFTNLKVQKRYLPIIRGAGTPFPASQGTVTTACQQFAYPSSKHIASFLGLIRTCLSTNLWRDGRGLG